MFIASHKLLYCNSLFINYYQGRLQLVLLWVIIQNAHYHGLILKKILETLAFVLEEPNIYDRNYISVYDIHNISPQITKNTAARKT